MMELEELVKIITRSLGSLAEGISALLIAYAVSKTLVSYGRNIVKKINDGLEARLALGKSLALSLEILLAADILRTAVSPSWDDIGKLSAIAALRTLLNYFLERDLRHSLQKES
jgi:uncharacterized membrane protein